MAPVNISILKAAEMQKAVEEKFGVHIKLNDTCCGLYYTFDEEPADEVLDFLKEYFENFEGGKLNMVLSPNKMNFSLADDN